MGSAPPIRDDLVIWVGRTFGPYGWPLRGNDGEPLRSATGISAAAQIRAHPNDADVLATWDAEVVERVVADDDQPIVLALITLTDEQTTALGVAGARTAVYDVVIDRTGEDNPPGVEGRLEIRTPVTRP